MTEKVLMSPMEQPHWTLKGAIVFGYATIFPRHECLSGNGFMFSIPSIVKNCRAHPDIQLQNLVSIGLGCAKSPYFRVPSCSTSPLSHFPKPCAIHVFNEGKNKQSVWFRSEVNRHTSHHNLSGAMKASYTGQS